jgi:hypothetical protein
MGNQVEVILVAPAGRVYAIPRRVRIRPLALSGRDRVRDQLAAGCPLGIYPVAAPSASLESRDNAPASTGGSSRPRRSARRMIPLAAFGVKKYFDRCGPVSKTSGKEDAIT